ncbi:hypothetical protein [Thermosediminibacter litoriperuensis]|uniref:Uncharacterized protein n=1 Tax=Thermosediminibacter litoriperuensis TaxID=291989 RepID=A0A5S5B099_9FIRM|nr:hypothetical protein [Thermosediminibacter litoriperuensis]TYP58543.1 hypothetical protein LZ11_00389 [Thermosediminibacter litoriperuensis]
MNRAAGKKTLELGAVLICLLIIFISGCTRSGDSDKKPPQQAKPLSRELTELLPEKAGFRWVYSGFAEYGHTMELRSIVRGETAARYEVEGEVIDVSGGEAEGDFGLRVEYEVKNGSLRMRKDSEKMMDNFSELELIRLPLKKGTQWEQKAQHKDGREYRLTCTIQKVEDDPQGKIYTVVYKDKDSDFYEKRRIQENWGVISFETVWESEEGPVTIGYDLYREASGYKK